MSASRVAHWVVLAIAAIAPGFAGAAVTPPPAESCQPVVYEGSGEPDVIVASDLPMQGPSRASTLAMTEAVRYVLRQRSFIGVASL